MFVRLVVSTHLKNMKVSWGYSSQYMGKQTNVQNHQPVVVSSPIHHRLMFSSPLGHPSLPFPSTTGRPKPWQHVDGPRRLLSNKVSKGGNLQTHRTGFINPSDILILNPFKPKSIWLTSHYIPLFPYSILVPDSITNPHIPTLSLYHSLSSLPKIMK